MQRVIPLILISMLLFGCGKARDTGVDLLKDELQRKEQLLKQKKAELEEAKSRESTVQKIFNDSEEVDAIQADIKAIKEGIKASRKEIRNLESGYSGGVRKAIFAGFWTTLVFMIILAIVADASFFMSELSIMLGSFFVFWTVFSIVIKFIFY